MINEKQAIKMPEKGNNTLKFNNFHKKLPVPFVIYVDFEAITEKIYTCIPESNESHTEAYQKLQIVDMVTKLCVVMKIDTASQFKYIEEKCCL